MIEFIKAVWWKAIAPVLYLVVMLAGGLLAIGLLMKMLGLI